MNRVVRLKTPDGPITSPSGDYEPLSRTARGMGLWAAECCSWLDFLLFTLAGGSRTMSHLLNRSSYSAAEAKASALVLHLLATFQVLSISLLLLCLIQTSECVNIDEDINAYRGFRGTATSEHVQHTDIVGSFQFRDIQFVEESGGSAIVASAGHLYRIATSTLALMETSDWLPSEEKLNELVERDEHNLWIRDDKFCNVSLAQSQFNPSKMGSVSEMNGITCRWFFYTLSPIHSDKLWTCFSKQFLSGCVQLDTFLQPVPGSEQWPRDSLDPAFIGSCPKTPWLTTWKSQSLVSFIPKTPDQPPQFSFVGNRNDLFSVSHVDNDNPLFAKLFQDTETYPIKSFVIDSYQYVFFHDKANEARSSYYGFDEPEKEYQRFSRVARLCVANNKSSDQESIPSVLLMARLVCGISKGSYNQSEWFQFEESASKFQYLALWNVISDVDFDEENLRFYATFNEHYLPKELLGAAICAFDKREIDRVLESGEAKKPRNERSENHLSWELQVEEIPLGLTTCSAPSASSSNSSSVSNEQLAQQFLPLMHDWVEPLSKRPIAHTNLYNLQKLTVDVYENYTQIYITTHSLNLFKLTVKKSESRKEPQITEVTLNFIVNLPQVGANNFEEGLFDDNFTYFVKLKHNSVYIGNTWTLYKADKNLCVKYTTCSDCVHTSRDPECLWNLASSKCESHVGGILPPETRLTNHMSSCSSSLLSPETSYQVKLLEPSLKTQVSEPVLALSEVTLFCGANFSISRTSNSTNQNPTLNLPHARWYEDSRDVSSQNVNKCSTDTVNDLTCFDPVSLPVETRESVSPGVVRKTVSGVSYTLLKVVAQKSANYTCVFHYAPKEFTSDSVIVRVTSRKEKADQLYAEYLEELRQYYIRKCEIDAYCETDGCNIDNQKRFQSCLTQQITQPNT